MQTPTIKNSISALQPERHYPLWVNLCLIAWFAVSLNCQQLHAGDAVDFQSKHPNFIVVLVDDLGAVDLGCYGGTYIKTPNIDRLAADGVRATKAYAASAICSPTRAAWITGRHPARLGITDWIRARFQRQENTTIYMEVTEFEENPSQHFRTPANPFYLPLSELTVAEIVRKRGYRTAHIGKWHLGDDPWYPQHQGFEINVGGCDYGQPPTYFDPYSQPKANHPMLQRGIPGLQSRKPGEFLTDREVDEAIALMHQWRNQPFYIELNHYAVHTPIEAPNDLLKEYQVKGKTQQQAKYAALVETVDRGMGKLRAAVGELDMKRPTVIVFTSDNGGLDQNGIPTDNAPLRDGKGTPYEGGLRIPFLIFGDGLFPGGTTLDQPICSMDWLPTVCELVGEALPEDREFDGVSLLPILQHPRNQLLNRSLTWHFPHYRGPIHPYSVLQQNDWKFIHHYGEEPELFDLANDPYEEQNLATKNTHQLESMRAMLFQELHRLDAKLPQAK